MPTANQVDDIQNTWHQYTPANHSKKDKALIIHGFFYIQFKYIYI